MKQIVFFCFLNFIYLSANAQNKILFSKINGKIFSTENTPLGNVIVFNTQKGQKTMTNSRGQFSILMDKNDTVYFIFPGYISKRMFFTKENLYSSYSITIALNLDKEILLKKYMEYRVNEVPENTSIIKPKSETQPNYLPSIELTKGGSKDPYMPNAIENPISFFYDRYNIVSKTRRKLEKNRAYRAKKYGDTITPINIEMFK